MNNYYNTGKVKIGVNYKPKPYVEKDKDMLYLQTCLLEKTHPIEYFLVPVLSMIRACFLGRSVG
jgi:hypothetical protein